MQQHKQVPRMNSFIYFTSQIHRTLIKMLHESAPPPPPPTPLPSIAPHQFYGHVEIMIVFGGIVSLIYHRPKWILY